MKYHEIRGIIMKHNKILSFTLIVVFALAMSSCQTSTQQDNDKLTIVTTIFPLYEFASNVAGDNAQVILLLPSGADPHHYEPRPSDIINIAECRCVHIYVGKLWNHGLHDAVESLNNDIMV
jgi:zinc transport system substrate-binding protein